MLTKERCMSLLDDIAGYAHRANIGPNGINEINEDYNGFLNIVKCMNYLYNIHNYKQFY